jgi:hypothetical protein
MPIFNLYEIVFLGTPYFSAKSGMNLKDPSGMVTGRLLRLLRACSLLVAHRQLPGS